MRACVAALVLVLAMQWSATAQRTRYAPLKGIVLDSTTFQPLEAATVSVFTLKDSSLLSYSTTNKKGEFLVPNVPKATECRLIISYSGLRSYALDFSIPEESKELIISTVGLSRSVESLREVTVSRMRPPVVIKKDTVEFNVGAIRTAENAVAEDLLKELPGVTVDPQGNITVNGKRVSKITVDGKDFFGTDVKLTSKNLPRDIIDKIQVVDFKTKEQQFTNAKTTGEEKAINLVLKKENKKGIFGRSSAGYGSDSRYEAGGNLNVFDARKQISFIGYANNTTGQNSGSGGVSLGSGTGGQGLFRAAGAGLNLNAEISKKVRLSSSLFSGSDQQHTDQMIRRLNILPDSSYYYQSQAIALTNNTSQRGAVQLEIKPDSLTEINISGSFGISRQRRTNGLQGTSSTVDGTTINKNIAEQEGTILSPSGGMQLFAGRRFSKPGRILTINLGANIGSRDGEDWINSSVAYFGANAPGARTAINQRAEIDGADIQLSGSITWLEPLTPQINIRATYGFNDKTGRNNRTTWARDSLTGRYLYLDSTFTNLFKSRVTTQTPSLYLDYSGAKLTAFAGLAVQRQSMKNISGFAGVAYAQNFTNLIPSANLSLQLSKSQMLMINYSGFSQPPSIEQLQPLPDISNTLYIRHGNPDLKPSFAHNLSANFQKTKGQTYWSASVNYATTQNLIVEEVWMDSVQHSRPINSNGNDAVNLNLSYSSTWRSGKHSLRWSAGPSLSYARNISFTNKVENKSVSVGIAPRINFTYTWGDLLVFQPTYALSFYDTRYSLQNTGESALTSHNLALNTQISLPIRLSLETNFQFTANSQRIIGIPRTISLLNAAINYYLDKKKAWMLRVSAFDVFNQNTTVRRVVTPAYIENSEAQMLRRYFLAGITWHLKQF